MSHFGDFMDGVPVKISEKYKRPPRIDLPYSATECPIRAQNVVDSAQYSATFEKNVLSKIRELRSAKETKKNERRHRLQLLEEAKQKKLDDIATAEAQEKLKQLSISEVSYPSTDEISAMSPEESEDRNCSNLQTQDNSPETAENTNEVIYSTRSTTDPEPNILQPIQVQRNYPQNNLLDDPDPLQKLKMNTKITRIKQSHNVDTLTYKDFENDTSSPFDNVELKTINDMELLAQVLRSEGDSMSSCPPATYLPDQIYTMSNCGSQAQMEGVPYLPNNYTEQPIQGPSVLYSPQHYPLSNGYYVPTENVCDNTMPMENMNMYMPNYQYFVPTNTYTDPTFYGNQIPNTDINTQNGPYIPQPYYYQYPQQVDYTPNAYSVQQQNSEKNPQDTSKTSQSTIKSRSRSVPDIVKELDDELMNNEIAKRRANERSNNASPAPKPVAVPHTSSGSEKRDERKSRRRVEHLPNPFEKLSLPLQDMCKIIHGMGFPLDRVARVCTLVGDNDKKIIEGLLILNQLMDLGFSEGRVSAALAKHEFNRDKALDELVS